MVLGGFGRFLGGLGSFWEVLEGFETFLGGFGWFWKVLGGFDRFGKVFRKMDSRGGGGSWFPTQGSARVQASVPDVTVWPVADDPVSLGAASVSWIM